MALRLDFTTLRIFLAVADTRNITRAAEREHIASSAVSKRLSDLEHMLGATLLYRQPRGVELTPAGEALRHHAQTILTSADRLAADLGDYAAGMKGHVRMMANMSSTAEFLPEDLSRFCERYPDISVDLQEAHSSAIVKAVADGQCEIGVFAGVEEDLAGIEVHDYRSDSFVLIVPAGHRLAERESIRFEEALGEYFIGPEAMSAWDAVLSRAALQANGRIRYRIRLKNSFSVMRMVGVGLGVSVLPNRMLEGLTSLRIRGIPLEDSWAERRINLATRRGDRLPPPARLMMAHLKGEPAPETRR